MSVALAGKDIVVLGIETSCDDTASSVIRYHGDGVCEILSSVIWSQHDEHAAYGGIVPEIAARSHVERLDGTVLKAVEQSGCAFSGIDAVAVTAGPGLIGGVMVGLVTAKAIALARNMQLVPVNHLEGHALSVRLTEQCPFPYLLLLVSGGHTQLIQVAGVGAYRRLGSTIDDAAGESFDKIARLLGLEQPGGPAVERLATKGRADRFVFPRPLHRRPGADFSFSGLKTAVRQVVEKPGMTGPQERADIAASFQFAVAAHLGARTARAMQECEEAGMAGRLVVAGGVAANGAVRSALAGICRERGWVLMAPPPRYCTDNGAMIALAGAERLATGLVPGRAESMRTPARARWPLAPPPEGRAIGGGRKGPRA